MTTANAHTGRNVKEGGRGAAPAGSALGRTEESYYPTESSLQDTAFAFVTDNITPATVTYDVLDRPLVQTAPDGSTTSFEYGFSYSNDLNKMLFSTITTDANGHSSTELKDVDGKPWAVQAAGQPFVYFDYNAVGDNTRTYAETGEWERSYTCDLLGRKTTYTEGQLFEEYRYDGQNLSIHIRDWYEDGGVRICTTWYSYTAHRLDSVRYDDALTTIYHYNAAGQPDSVYDESGVMCYEYGNMGEVTRETRIYALPFLFQSVALSTQFSYDSWGRVQSITYPDGEVVHYAYDLGGQLERMYNSSYTYLDDVAYDRFGAKVSQEYGNGITTDYSYNNVTRRLSAISTTNNGTPMSQIQYAYDPVGNVTQVTSTCPWLPNHTFTESFTYDASDQLTAASETGSNSYRLSVLYDNWGKVNTYDLTQTDLLLNPITQPATTQNTYVFNYPDPNNPQDCQTGFAPELRNFMSGSYMLSLETLTYGINGSLRRRDNPQMSVTEYYLHNSAGNLKAYSNNGLDFAYYGYDAANTRTYKLSMYNLSQWLNGQPQPLQLQLQSAMFYPNAYLTFNANGEYTKHYYNGSERICSRLGDNVKPIAATGNGRLAYRTELADWLSRSELQELVSIYGYNAGTPATGVNVLISTGTSNDIFYYHTNHLGSTAFVTDNNATVTQGFLYAPFGEIITEYAPMWQNGVLPKYAFNAKELDEETGMYYYEARYYNPPVFTSRDPMFEKYFWMSPYAYCANNPMKFVDPTGMDFVPVVDNENMTITIKATYYTYGAENKKDLSEAVAFWNAQKGYSYQFKKADGTTETYAIQFELTVNGDYSTQEEAREAFNQHVTSQNQSNFYAGKTSENSKERGGSTSNRIRINPEQVVDVNRTLSHEIGHTLGIPDLKNMIKDDNGLMVSGGNGMEINSEYIQHMFSKFHFGNISSPSVYYMQDAKTHNSRWDGIFESDFKKDMQHGRVIK